MNRAAMLSRMRARREPWDLVIVGGGATGIGIAVDAASRGYEVLLCERADFGTGTSSRSTKLAHGGVRYLEQGNIGLVLEALKERGILRRNAPHLVRDLAFVVPNYDWWEAPFYGFGLKVYDRLAGQDGFGPSQILSRAQTLERLPTIRPEGLRGGVVYYDGQFDDARLLINLAATAVEQGATLANYVQVVAFTRSADGFLDGIVAREVETGEALTARARVVINAAGPFVDHVRRMADPGITPLIAPSQGIHLVLDRSFLPGDSAVMIPRTNDGRVMFAIPWHGHALLGTTDTPIDDLPLEPCPTEEEIDVILTTAGTYLRKPPSKGDVLSMFAGIRPLIKSGDGRLTAALSRDHRIQIDGSGLLTIAGGKWTTYRRMAEDCLNQAAVLARLPDKPCVTARLMVHGSHQQAEQFGHLSVYGSDAPAVQDLINRDAALAQPLHRALSYCGAEVVWATRCEMARTVEDVLARRTRALFLNARAAIEMAPRVAELMARELGQNEAWEAEQLRQFQTVAGSYIVR